jgi:hypothetical protein
LSIAPAMTATASFPAFCASQNSAWLRTFVLRSSRAVATSVVNAAGTLLTDRPKVTFSLTLSLGSCAIIRA